MSYKLHVISLLLTSCFLLLTSARSAYAHVLKTNGQVGAVLHIAPEDDPVAGENSSFFFEFKDKDNKFKPENCECLGKIFAEGEEIYSAPLFQNSSNPSLEDASFSYTFPKKGIYKVEVVGKPVSGDFESFTLSWDVRVEREADRGNSQKVGQSTNWLSAHRIHFLLVIPATIFMIYAIIRSRK